MTYIPNTGRIVAENSSTAALNAAAAFTGTWVDLKDFQAVTVALSTDQDATIQVQFSPDGTNADSTLTRYYRVGEINPPEPFEVTRRYFRVVVTNTSSSNQTYMRLQTMAGDRGLLNIPTDSVMSQRYASISVRPTDFRSEVALGRRQNQTTWNKFGYNDDVDTAAAETIWSAGGRISPLTTARTLSVVSASANDAAAGTGARTVTIIGVDANFQAQTETVTMNGTTPVVTTGTWRGVNRMVVATAGSGATNAGVITATASTDLTTQAHMPAGEGTSQQAFFFVQADHTALASWLFLNCRKLAGGTAPRVTFRGWVRNLDTGTNTLVFRHDVDTAVENTVELRPAEPFVIGQKCLLEFTCETNSNDTQAACRFSLIEHTNVGA